MPVLVDPLAVSRPISTCSIGGIDSGRFRPEALEVGQTDFLLLIMKVNSSLPLGASSRNAPFR